MKAAKFKYSDGWRMPMNINVILHSRRTAIAQVAVQFRNEIAALNKACPV
jgi:hypothetical protein